MLREELSLSDQELLSHVLQFWGFKAESLDFIDIGSAFAFRLEISPDLRAFLKVYPKDDSLTSAEHPTPQSLERTGKLLKRLKTTYGLDKIPSIICTRDGMYFSETENYFLVLYEFLDGSHPTHEANELNACKLATIFSKLHGLPAEGFPEVPQETFDTDYALGIKSWLQSIPIITDKYGRGMAQKLMEHHDLVEKSTDVLKTLKNRFISTAMEIVLTHGDPHHYNILQTSSDLFLIDWYGLKMAPRERDLCHHEFTPVVNDYLRLNLNIVINHDLCFFYQIQRFLEDVRFYLEQPTISEEQRAENQKAFCDHWGWTLSLDRVKAYGEKEIISTAPGSSCR